MIVNDPDFEIIWQADDLTSETHVFCQIYMRVDSSVIGDVHAWSVLGLVNSAISNLVIMLLKQRALPEYVSLFMRQLSCEELFNALYSWQWESGEWAYKNECPLSQSDAGIFNALPIGTEIFDGENAYLIFIPDGLSTFVWRDFESKKICEKKLNFDDYLNRWVELKDRLLPTAK